MPEFILRPAKTEDAAAVAEVNITTWHAAYAGLLPRYQKRGIGRQLMEKFSAYTGGNPFYLYMLAGNRAAAFYRQTGGIRRPEYDRTHQWQGIETKLELFLFNG